MFDFSVYSIVSLTGGILVLIMAATVWMRKTSPGAFPLILFMLAAAVWTIGSAFEVAASDIFIKTLFCKIEYTGVVSAGIFWVIFVLDYTGSKWHKRPGNIVLLSIIPALTFILVITNEMHGLIWSDVYITMSPFGDIAIWERGMLFWMNPVYQYILYAYGIIFLGNFGLRKPYLYRKQVIVLLIGTSIPVLVNIFYILALGPTKGFDLTPISITCSAMIYSIVIFRYKFLEVLPIAHHELIRNLPDGIVVCDQNNRIIETNIIFENLVNREKINLIRKKITDIMPTFQRILENVTDDHHFEMEVKNSDKEDYYSINSVSLYGKRRESIGKIYMFRNITMQKSMQDDLKSAYDQEKMLHESLEEEIEKRSQYTKAMVHELRTPLTSIIASSDLLESQVQLPIQQDLVKNILRSSLNLDQRVNELFDLSRGEMGLLKINPEPIWIQSLLKEIINEITPVAEKKNLQVISDLEEANILINGDKSRLRQVLYNILNNSLKFTFSGKIIIRSYMENQNSVLLQIEDTGKGISPQQIPHLFSPYKRNSNEVNSSSGLGIGLTLSKMYVELHHGKIWVESTPGKGTKVSFTLPTYNETMLN